MSGPITLIFTLEGEEIEIQESRGDLWSTAAISHCDSTFGPTVQSLYTFAFLLFSKKSEQS